MTHEELLTVLQQKRAEVVILLDADAQDKAQKFAAQVGPWARVARLPPEVEDPGALAPEHQDAIQAELKQARSVLAVLCDQVKGSTGAARTPAINVLFKAIASWNLSVVDADSVCGEVVSSLSKSGINKTKYKDYLRLFEKEVPADQGASQDELDEQAPTPAPLAMGVGQNVMFFGVPSVVRTAEGYGHQWHVLTSSKTRQPVAGQILVIDGERFRLSPGGEGLANVFDGRLDRDAIKRILHEEPPTAAGLLGALIDTFGHHLYVTDHVILSLLSVWTIATYLCRLFNTFPYLHVHGPGDSAKSKVLDLLDCLGLMAQSSASTSVSSLFRTIETVGGIFLIDEAEDLSHRTKDNQDMFAVLNQGYRAGGYVVRTEKIDDAFVPTAFRIFGPKVLANIKGLHPVLASRCIRIQMLRAPRGQPQSKTEIVGADEQWILLRAELYAYALHVWREVRRVYMTDSSVQLGGRRGQLWAPLLAVASVLEEGGIDGLVAQLRDWALGNAEDDTLTEFDHYVLACLGDMMGRANLNVIGVMPKEILEEMERQNQGELDLEKKPAACQSIARVLRRFGFGRDNGKSRRRGTPYTIERAALQEVITTYLPDTTTAELEAESAGGAQK